MLNDMTKVLEVNPKARTMKVQGQILYKDVYEAATAAGLSVKGGTVGFWQGLTIGGSISAGTHGTGLGVESNVVSARERKVQVSGYSTYGLQQTHGNGRLPTTVFPVVSINFAITDSA